jgi:branched-chain amino acid transport system substrate-binding protein
MYIEQMNAAGGIHGVKIVPTFIDEGLGSDKLVSEYRRVVQEEGARVMLASISSGSCNTIAPVAEDLKVVNIMWDCAAQKILEDKRYRYVVRTEANTTQEYVAAVLYLLRTNPNFKTIAVVNQDYAHGRDSWEMIVNTLKILKPDVQVVAELFPKFGATDYSTEVSRLLALKPDVIVSTSWGGDLDTFIRQAAQRGLMKRSVFMLALGESSLERLGTSLPDGVLIGARGDHYFKHPEFENDPKFKSFIDKFKAKTGAYPIYPVFHMAQALEGLAAGYDRAIKANKGQWPTTEQLADALHGAEFRGLTRNVVIREDGQGMESQLWGVTKKVPGYAFPILDNIVIYPPEILVGPVGTKSLEWIKTLKPEVMKDPRIKAFPPIKS